MCIVAAVKGCWVPMSSGLFITAHKGEECGSAEIEDNVYACGAAVSLLLTRQIACVEGLHRGHH